MNKLDMVVHARNSSTGEVEAGRSQMRLCSVSDQPKLYSKNIFKKIKMGQKDVSTFTDQ
jgi:hypothetical protein